MSLRVRVISYNIPKENRIEIVDKLRQFGFKLDDPPADPAQGYYAPCEEMIVSAEDIDRLHEYGDYLEIKPMKRLRFFGDLPRGKDLPEAFKIAQVTFEHSRLHDAKGVCVLENCCTDELQRKLDAGFFIIAVCPTPNRRPDYILGHSDKGAVR